MRAENLAKARAEFWTAEYVSGQGVRVKTQLFASNLAGVRDEVRARGGQLLHAEPYVTGWLQKEFFSSEYRLAFLRGLRFHLRANASAGQALALMVQTEPNERLRSHLTGALDVIQNGGAFSEALRALNLFDAAVIGMLVAGELSGDVQSAIAAAEAYMAESGGWLKAWKSFAGWLAFEVSTALSGLWAMHTTFIPELRSNMPATKDLAALESYKSALTLADQSLMGLFWLSIGGMAAMGVAYLLYRHGSSRLRNKVERMLLAVPGARAVLLDADLSFTFGLLSHMLTARLKISEAIPLVAKYSKVPSVKEFWHQVESRMGLGATLPRAFDHRFVEPSERIVLAAHQDSEQLAFAMKLIASNRDEATKRGRNRALKLYGLLTGAYIAVVVLVGVWLLRLQGAGLNLTSVDGAIGF